MSNRTSDLLRLFLVSLLIAAGLFGYDRYIASQRVAVEAQTQQAVIAKTVAEVKVLTEKTEQQHIQAEADTRKQELELKRLELEIKRAEADQAMAVMKQKEIEAQEAEKKRVADKASQAEERKLMEAETQREQAKRDDARKQVLAVKQARQEREDTARRFNELFAKRQAAQGAMIAWKNKLEAARNSKAKAQGDLAVAQTTRTTPATDSGADSRSQRGNDPLDGIMGGQPQQRRQSGNPNSGGLVFGNDAAQGAQEQIAAASRAETEAAAALDKAQKEFEAVNMDYESALTEKQNAERRLAIVAPAPDKNKVFATYLLNDGRKLSALCVIESGDDIWVKTAEGVELIKRSEIEEVGKE